ncbi:MAG: glycosyltransferase family 39 protein [Polyangiaceae bacterium]
MAILRREAVFVTAVALAVLYPFIAHLTHLRMEVAGVVYVPVALVLAWRLLAHLRFDRGTIAIMLAGLCAYFAYLTYTTPGERNYDGPEQIKYLTYIFEKGEIPPSKYCFICHHPPLYYILAAGSLGFWNAVKLIPPNPLGLMIFSLVIFFAFLVYGALFARLYAEDSRVVRIATALLVFWPYSFHNSVRVHNDTLATTLVGAGMYYTALWHKKRSAKHLYAAALCAALGILTKSTAFALVAVIGLLLAWDFFTQPDKLRTLGRGVAAMAIVGLAFGIGAQRAPVGDDPCHRRFGTACDIRPSDFTGNKPKNYLYFDVPKFLGEPYMVIANDDSGKQYFWNHVLKSSLFGTHNKIPDRETAYDMNKRVAWWMNLLLFGMVIYALVAGALDVKRGLRRHAVPLLFCVFSSLFLMGFKIIIPAPHHTDFRHIYFVMIPGALLFATAVTHMRTRAEILGKLGTVLYAPFLGLSIFYFLPKYDLVMQYTSTTVEMPIAAVKRPVAEGTPWDRDGNVQLEGNETLVLKVDPPAPQVHDVDVSVDGNDTYEIKVVGDGPPRVLIVRPPKVIKIGLGRYKMKVDPPVENVKSVTVRPLGGDRTYSLGHFILNP